MTSNDSVGEDEAGQPLPEGGTLDPKEEKPSTRLPHLKQDDLVSEDEDSPSDALDGDDDPSPALNLKKPIDFSRKQNLPPPRDKPNKRRRDPDPDEDDEDDDDDGAGCIDLSVKRNLLSLAMSSLPPSSVAALTAMTSGAKIPSSNSHKKKKSPSSSMSNSHLMNRSSPPESASFSSIKGSLSSLSSLQMMASRNGSSSTTNAESLNHMSRPKGSSPSSASPSTGASSLHMNQHTIHHHNLLAKDSPLRSTGANSIASSPSSAGKGPGNRGIGSRPAGSHGRQNPWQTQWINRSSEQTRDVFTCVWCKDSFKSLQEMTIHMKESPRCGMAGMQHAAATAASSSSVSASSSSMSASATSLTNNTVTSPSSSGSMSNPLTNGSKHHGPSSTPSSSPASHSNRSSSSSHNIPVATASASTSSASASGSLNKDLMSNAVLAKNNVSLPRKLVRGQDVWLGRGQEQTRQILKCMWCAQSFKTLEEMTRHMRVTQHYTNIISQEQIISWRTPEDKLAQQQVNAVLTCKVCDEAFGSLKELSHHMVRNAHYKEHILRSITEGGHGRRRQTRERRKKSLPVRKLLELERMEMPAGSETRDSPSPSSSERRKCSPTPPPTPGSTSSPANLIKCDECGARVEPKNITAHLTNCLKNRLMAAAMAAAQQHHSRNTDSPTGSSRSSVHSSASTSPPPLMRRGPLMDDMDNMSEEDEDETPVSMIPPSNKKRRDSQNGHHSSSGASTSLLNSFLNKDGASKSKDGGDPSAPSSASLSALQSLIDKSFDLKMPGPLPSPASASSPVGHMLSPGVGLALPSSLNPRAKPTTHHHHHPSASATSSHKPKVIPSSVPSSSFSSVEKWMALAKERDASTPNRNQPGAPNGPLSMSSSNSNSSWMNSDEEGDGSGMNLSKKALISAMKERGSPASSASSRPSSIPRPQSQSPGPSDGMLPISSSHKKHTITSSKSKGNHSVKKEKEDRDIPLKSEEEERREQIEELKRAANDPMTHAAAQAKSTSSASLSALEKLIEKSFDSKKKNTPTGFLQRLGIDEEVCPPWQPGLGMGMAGFAAFGNPFQNWMLPKSGPGLGGDRSASSSPSKGTKNGSVSSSPPV